MHRGEAGTGPFMLTLCRLVEPVSIRPPQSPHLRPFTFFTSRAPRPDGTEQLYLHMGFFDTLGLAEKWARAVRGRHPDAAAAIAPPALRLPAASDSRRFAPVAEQSLTDTQVLDILEMRHRAPAESEREERGGERIELLRPEDTGTRRALKEAVVAGMPVAFALQLHWSARPIDPGSVSPHPVLSGHALYAVESRSADRSRFFLRLGFFADPLSAKQVASHLRSSFPAAAVVPVLDEEVMRAREACIDPSSIPCLVQERLDPALESGGTGGWAMASKPERGRRRSASQGTETLEQTLAQLAEREMLNDPDLLSDTGVRHLKVEVEASGGRR